MKLPHLGHAVVINNLGEEFIGTKSDVVVLKETFTAIGLTVQIFNNCTKQQMWKIRSRYTTNEDHSEYNCFLMVVMCHGSKEGKLYDVDGNEAFRIDQLIEEISATKTLNGKPKLFFFDSCRGDEEMHNYRGKAYPNCSEDICTPASEVSWPDLTDVWVAYPTMPGYQAYGGDDDGSIYQQALAKCLMEKFRTHDLSAIHRMVKQIMARDAQGDNSIQVAEERNGLRYLLRFRDFQNPVPVIRQPTDACESGFNNCQPGIAVPKTKTKQHRRRTEGLRERTDDRLSTKTVTPSPKVFRRGSLRRNSLELKKSIEIRGRSPRLAVFPDTMAFATVTGSFERTWDIRIRLSTEEIAAYKFDCSHEIVLVCSVIVKGKPKLVVGCSKCRIIKISDVECSNYVSEVSIPYTYNLEFLFAGGKNQLVAAYSQPSEIIVQKYDLEKNCRCESVTKKRNARKVSDMCYDSKHNFVVFTCQRKSSSSFFHANGQGHMETRASFSETCYLFC